jgi:hypothetical protein
LASECGRRAFWSDVLLRTARRPCSRFVATRDTEIEKRTPQSDRLIALAESRSMKFCRLNAVSLPANVHRCGPGGRGSLPRVPKAGGRHHAGGGLYGAEQRKATNVHEIWMRCEPFKNRDFRVVVPALSIDLSRLPRSTRRWAPAFGSRLGLDGVDHMSSPRGCSQFSVFLVILARRDGSPADRSR